MKAFRIVQLVGFLLVAGYLILLYFSAPDEGLPIPLPVFPIMTVQVPAVIVLGVSLLLGFIAGAVPGQIGLWRRRREIHKLERRIRELEHHRPSYLKTRSDDEPEVMVPDRRPDFAVPAEDI